MDGGRQEIKAKNLDRDDPPITGKVVACLWASCWSLFEHSFATLHRTLARTIRLRGLFLNHLMECTFVCFSASHVLQKQPFPVPMRCAVQFWPHKGSAVPDRPRYKVHAQRFTELKSNRIIKRHWKRKTSWNAGLVWEVVQDKDGQTYAQAHFVFLPRSGFPNHDSCPISRESAFKQKRSVSLCIDVSKWIICFLPQVPSQPQAKVERASRRLQAFEVCLVSE